MQLWQLLPFCFFTQCYIWQASQYLRNGTHSCPVHLGSWVLVRVRAVHYPRYLGTQAGHLAHSLTSPESQRWKGATSTTHMLPSRIFDRIKHF